MVSVLTHLPVERCLNDGTSEALPCSSKLVVTVAVSPGGATEGLVAQAVSESGSTLMLASPIRIRWAQSQPTLMFPYTYRQTVNAKPTESVIAKTAFQSCSVGGESPTCGWYLRDGVRVPFSSGFCCSCTFSDVVSPSGRTRAGNNCGVESLFGSTTFTTAHCLRFSDLYYDMHDVERAEASYEIVVGLTSRDARNVTVEEVVRVGPTRLRATSQSGLLLAEVVGDFAPFKYADGAPSLCVCVWHSQSCRVRQPGRRRHAFVHTLCRRHSHSTASCWPSRRRPSITRGCSRASRPCCWFGATKVRGT